jgi:hypothetical protein
LECISRAPETTAAAVSSQLDSIPKTSMMTDWLMKINRGGIYYRPLICSSII